MSDRSAATVTIYAIADPVKHAAVWDLLQENNLGIEYYYEELTDSAGEVGLRLGLDYVHSEMVVGALGQVARDLAALGATFYASQYHNDGVGAASDVYRHTPELGLHAVAAIESEPVVGADVIAELIAATEDHAGLVRALEQRTGTTWASALKAACAAVEPDHGVDQEQLWAAGPVSAPLPLCGRCKATNRADCTCPS